MSESTTLSPILARERLRILVLDSCRDNPLDEELKRSIGRPRAAAIARPCGRSTDRQGMLVAFATAIGRTADDGQVATVRTPRRSSSTCRRRRKSARCSGA